MTGKVVFITGAAAGIGFEMASAFAKAGARVVISDINEEQLNVAVAKLRSANAELTGVRCDVTKEADIRSALQTTHEKLGRIDVLINNAGIQHVSTIEDFPVDKFELMLRIMLTAPFIAIKNVFPVMKRQRFGRIINMASINGLVGFAGKAAYNSAKHGVIGLTKVAALEGATHNITVNALCPGYVETELVKNQLAGLAATRNISIDKVLEEVIYPLVPQKRLLSVAEIAAYALFLAGDSAGGVTGQAIVIDGGYTAQ